MSVNIVYLPYRRFHFSEVLLKILSQVRGDFQLTVCGMSHQAEQCQQIVDAAKAQGISSEKLIVQSDYLNYIDKLKKATEMPFKYSIKLDEDIFLNQEVWQYWLDQLSILDDEENLCLSPVLSSGIPTVDNFVYQNFDQTSKTEIYRLFTQAKIPNLWGADYFALDQLLKTSGYESDSFYQKVSQIPHYYKGIHPVRASKQVLDYLNSWIINHIEKFTEKRDYSIEGSGRPYFCNSTFAIKTDVWKKILHDPSLKFDNFDEVSLNKYRERKNKKLLFIANTFGIHTAYNTLLETTKDFDWEDLNKLEEKLFQAIKKQVNEYYGQ